MAKKRKERAQVLAQRQLAPGIYDCLLKTELAKDAHPGQFIALYPKDKSTLLPRPISICEADAGKNTLRIVYRVVGAGTKEFSGMKPGDSIDILGILGNGFPLDAVKEDQTAFLMGGGIGVPPILELARKLNCRKQIIVGYRDAGCFLKEDFERYGEVYIATEDGSVGTKGNVMDAIRENGLKADVIYACGPLPMLRAIKRYAKEAGIDAYISLEERMACGVGACLGCVCKTTKKDAHSHVNNARVCTDGPVFEAKEVDI
ncbi:MAG TPA: dihydroorotate dehydrogenase electron transfer subunit [Candidatus Eisenbergiella merdipullorum]|uniref:Dihydroorotate dehydrogenase B (NAD(+)), electron transfer subunit n=1 Tax=Candidatus Eisenbergiella merdipullorum TaxID=2838553 RepID=A0A9D2I9Q4_9FIRM|nr:dihydroorotate dehydrogenase electron transfer subunit [Candidatus Eisenbergiella merdipullorum]